MATDASPDAVAAPLSSPWTTFWKKVFMGASIVLIVGVAWRAVYVSNQKEMKLRRALRKSQSIHAALHDVPARRFSTIDARPSPTHRNDLVERYS
ncbi:hypothetical protein LSCM1_01774 [Leishmania martiniquensis]|uniref:Uncharacterized protein n=1 Tax=Leishmania martiniquensis TaxID=1580590 RepID=A0A836H519_9TRYP|nr:hypothetical protein LSCM1_01774 [Leishmania martiniquensis]